MYGGKTNRGLVANIINTIHKTISMDVNLETAVLLLFKSVSWDLRNSAHPKQGLHHYSYTAISTEKTCLDLGLLIQTTAFNGH